ncbi:MAG: hypothetical protein P1V51_07890 [Deltaproteobacteria bacterium]|nr:hypothetical protein [Deltaproteobacteria bacterium]
MKARRVLLPALLLLGIVSSATSCQKGCTPQAVQEDVEKTTTAASRTGISVELKHIRSQIEMHRRMNGGENPPSLQAIETLTRLKYADEYSYDPTTGVVTSQSHPEL